MSDKITVVVGPVARVKVLVLDLYRPKHSGMVRWIVTGYPSDSEVKTLYWFWSWQKVE